MLKVPRGNFSQALMVDQALIEKVKNSDQNAFKMMYDDCIRYVYSIVKRYVSNHSDHQDIIQEIFPRQINFPS